MNQGFTLIELLVSILVMGILSAFLFLGKTQGEKTLALQSTTFNLAQDLREIQEMAMGAGEADCGTFSFGFNPDSLSYTLFADCNENRIMDDLDEVIRDVNLKEGVEFCDVSPLNLNVVFTPPEPISYINGLETGIIAEITLCLTTDHSKQKKIKVNTVGKIEIE